MDHIKGTLSKTSVNISGHLSETSGQMTGVLSRVTTDHTVLTGRDADDQHPIKAITNLEPELDFRPNSALTNEDILNILNT